MSAKATDDARNTMLGRIRAGLAASPGDAGRRSQVAARLKSYGSHLIPQRVESSAGKPAALFRAFLEGQSATVMEVAQNAEIPSAVAAFLRRSNLPQRVRMGEDAFLGGLDWSREPALERDHGRAAADDEVGLSHALGGVAETGTLVLASGAANPVTLNYLPETQIVVVSAKDIVGTYESAFDHVRRTYGPGKMPRTVNLISGPSRTGDIGGRLVMGAHGPRRLCVIIVNEAAPTTGD